MFQNILDLFFILKLVKRSKFYAPKNVLIHIFVYYLQKLKAFLNKNSRIYSRDARDSPVRAAAMFSCFRKAGNKIFNQASFRFRDSHFLHINQT